MGHTHSWTYRRGFTDQEWDRLLAEAKRIVAQAGHGPYGEAPHLGRGEPILLAGPKGTLWPLFDREVIALNGKKPNHHGSFVLFKEPAGRGADGQEDDTSSGCCETGDWPYDAVVASVLAAARAIAPGAIKVRCEDSELTDDLTDTGVTHRRRVFFVG